MLLHFAFRDRILDRLCITWWTSYPVVLGLKVIEDVDVTGSNIIVSSITSCFLMRRLSWVRDALLTTWLWWSIVRVLWVPSVSLSLRSWGLVWSNKASSGRASKRVVKINWGLVIIIVRVPWLQLTTVIFLEQILGHALQSFLVLRNILMDVFNLTRLYGLFRYFLDLDSTSLSTISIFLIILLTQNLNLWWYRVIAYLAVIVVLLILSE